jgi:hypothetical protein
MIWILIATALCVLLTQQYGSPRSHADDIIYTPSPEEILERRKTATNLSIDLYDIEMDRLELLLPVYKGMPEHQAIKTAIMRRIEMAEEQKRKSLISNLRSTYDRSQEARERNWRNLPTSELEKLVADLKEEK